MASVDFPAELGSPLISGYTEEAPKNIIRTTMENGPAKVRRIGTANTIKVSCSFVWDPAQLAIFKDFYYNFILEGALRFNWYYKGDGGNREARITNPFGLSYVDVNNARVTLSLEILPQ